MRIPTTKKIAVIYPASVPWIALCLDGVRRYAQEVGDWHLFSSPPTLRGSEEHALTMSSLKGWKGDAIIAVTNDPKELSEALGMGIPVVNLAGGLETSQGVPRVLVDYVESGRMAADHLLDRNLKHLAFFGWKGLWYSEQRYRGFAARAQESNISCVEFQRDPSIESTRSWVNQISETVIWLRSLPKPVGIFAVHDYRAQFLIEACHEAQLSIPHDVAIIGMDNDLTICEHSRPTLSSISRNSESVGWAAAALLDQMMQGNPSPIHDTLIQPDGVVSRKSTDMFYCTDPISQEALNYMKAHLTDKFNMDQVAEHLGISKRSFEMRFRDAVGTSPHDFLTRLRVRHAQELMKNSQKTTLGRLAHNSGFSNLKSFYDASIRITGKPPGKLRRKS